jgi:glycosyltransferase involved in cell wall biosynthesis
MEKILVAICNYNHSQYLKQSIESIQNQTYDNLDICVVDDGSTDLEKVKDIVESAKGDDPRIRFINFGKNLGKWAGLNTAIQTSNAIICTASDADDVSLPQRIELQRRVMKEKNSAHNLCGFHHCWNEKDVTTILEEHKPLTDINIIDHETVNKAVMWGNANKAINHYYTGEFETAGVSAMFFKSSWNVGLRFFPPNIGLRTMFSEDSDFNFRMTVCLASTSITAEKLYLYRRNTSTNTEEM